MPKIFTSRPTRLEWIVFCFIIVLAALLRLGWSGNVEFGKDSYHLSSLALDMVHGRSFPLLGIRSSVGLPNAPMSVYLMAIPFALSDSPLVASGYVALLNVISVGMLYVLARRYYGPRTAIVATLLYAVGPRAVIYSRFIWQQNLLPFFVIATVGTGLLGFLEQKRWAQLLHLPLLSITVQIHYAAIALIPITVVLVAIGRRNIRREFLFSVLLAALVTLPFVLGAAAALRADNLNKVALNGTPNGITITNAAVYGTAFAISGKLLRTRSGLSPEESLFNLLPIVAAVAALWLIFRLIRRRDNRSPVDLTMLIWFMGTAVVFSFTWTAVYLHYMVAMLPGAFMVIGATVGDLLQAPLDKRIRQLILVPGAIGFSVLVIAQVVVITVFVISSNLPNVVDSTGVPLGYYTTVRQAILAKGADRVVMNLEGFDYEQAMWRVLLYNAPSIQFVSGGTDIYPANKAVYVSHKCTAGFETFWLSYNNTCYGVGSHGPDALDLAAYTSTNQPGLTFASGAHIMAYRWQPEKGCLSLGWKLHDPMLPEAPPGYVGPNNLFALRFYTTDKTITLRVEDMGWQGDYLHIGDVATKSFCLNADQQKVGNIAGVRIGMYMVGGAQAYAADLFDPNGQYVDHKLMDIPFEPDVKDDIEL
jgi:4-amino-4-deoxy-L-arabinose transferase-like glycosyltransferase